jgi:hypothetical protein
MLAMHGQLYLPKRDGHNGRPLTVRPAVHARATPVPSRGKLPGSWPSQVAQIQAAQINCAMQQYSPAAAQGSAAPYFGPSTTQWGSVSAPANLPTAQMLPSAPAMAQPWPVQQALQSVAGNAAPASAGAVGSDMLATLRLLLALQSHEQGHAAAPASGGDATPDLSAQLQTLSLHLGSAGMSSSNGIHAANLISSNGANSVHATGTSSWAPFASMGDPMAAMMQHSISGSSQSSGAAHIGAPIPDRNGHGSLPLGKGQNAPPLPGALDCSPAAQLAKLCGSLGNESDSTAQQVKLWMQNVDAAEAGNSSVQASTAITSSQSNFSP